MIKFRNVLCISAIIAIPYAATAGDDEKDFYRIEGHLSKAVRSGVLVQICDREKLHRLVKAQSSLRKIGDLCFKFGEKAEMGRKTPGVYVEEIVKFPPS